MKENTLNKILIACSLLLLFGCKAKKLIAGSQPVAVVATPAGKSVSSNSAQLDPIRASQINFNSFTGKAKASLDIDGSSNDCTLNIRIKRDKEIWVSITYLIGFEVARAMITPDSIIVINRLQGVYLKKPFDYVHAYTDSQVNYTMLQALLVGNAIPQVLNDSTQYQAATDNITLSGNLKDLVYKLILGNNLKVTQTSLENHGAGQTLKVSNQAFIQAAGNTVPSQIAIASVAKDKKIQVNLHYIKVDFNQPQEYPFTIPDSYTPSE
jgi:hypothetical protein